MRYALLLVLAGCGVPEEPRTDTFVERRIFAVGQVEAASREIELAFAEVGPIREIPVQAGEHVTAGQLLACLDDAVVTAECKRAAAQVGITEAEVRLRQCAMEEAERRASLAGRLSRTRAVPPEESRQAEAVRRQQQAALDLALAQCSAARAELAGAEARRSRHQLCAPLDGMVVGVEMEAGEVASHGPVVVLVASGPRRVRAYAEELDALNVTVGTICRMEVEHGPCELSGRVIWISPELAPKRLSSMRPSERVDVLTREVLIEFDQPSDLPIGLRMDVFMERS